MEDSKYSSLVYYEFIVNHLDQAYKKYDTWKNCLGGDEDRIIESSFYALNVLSTLDGFLQCSEFVASQMDDIEFLRECRLIDDLVNRMGINVSAGRELIDVGVRL